MDFLRDQIWQFVGAVLGLLALLATLVIFVLQRRRKRLAIGALSRQRLVSIDQEISSRVTVSLDGSPVSDVHLVLLGIKNVGDLPILQSDFAGPFRLLTTDGSQILSASIVKQFPLNLGTQLTHTSDIITIVPPLLNRLDWFTVQILMSGSEANVTPDLRVVGVSQIEPLENKAVATTGNVVLTGLAGFLFGLAGSLLFDPEKKDPILFVIGQVLAGAALTVLATAALRYTLARRHIANVAQMLPEK
jgi:hypothetical protein